MHKQAGRVRISDHSRGRQQHAITLVNGTVAIEVVGLAVVLLIVLGHELPGKQGFSLGQGQVGGEPAGPGHAIDHARGFAAGLLGPCFKHWFPTLAGFSLSSHSRHR